MGDDMPPFDFASAMENLGQMLGGVKTYQIGSAPKGKAPAPFHIHRWQFWKEEYLTNKDNIVKKLKLKRGYYLVFVCECGEVKYVEREDGTA
jgi:hypothetical protein